MDITQAAAILRPGTAWNYDGKELKQANDGTPRVSVPSLSDLTPVMDSDRYIEDRLAAYPPIGDQLDAIWKGGKEFDDMKAAIQAVKTGFPKP